MLPRGKCLFLKCFPMMDSCGARRVLGELGMGFAPLCGFVHFPVLNFDPKDAPGKGFLPLGNFRIRSRRFPEFTSPRDHYSIPFRWPILRRHPPQRLFAHRQFGSGWFEPPPAFRCAVR